MTTIQDRKTLGERYLAAMESSHLELTEGRDDADYLIAAGWCKEPLGLALYRLRLEYDQINQVEAQSAGPVQAKLLTLNKLTTLRPAFTLLKRFAELHALRKKYNRPDRTVHLIAASCLAWWLHPTCLHCAGRGFNGGFGTPMLICTHCNSGQRVVRYAKDEAGHQFGRGLLNEMDSLMQAADSQMRKSLRQG